MTIDLEGLFDEQPEETNTKPKGKGKKSAAVPPPIVEAGDTSGITDLVLAGAPVSADNPSQKVAAAPPRGLAEIYDEYLKRVYLFDISGSMLKKVLGKESIDDINWGETDSHMWSYLFQRIAECKAKEERLNEWMAENVDPEGEDEAVVPYGMQMDGLEVILSNAPEPAVASDDVETIREKVHALKMFILEQHIYEEAGFSIKPTSTIPSRIQLVATVVRTLIEKRFDKYPDADVSAFAFDTSVHQLESRPKEQLLSEISNLPRRTGGGTSIQLAFKAAFELIRKQPSAMEMNHIIVVTDAEDSCADFIKSEAARRCEQYHIAVDFIHVASRFADFDENTVEALKKLCTDTKGEYTKVTTESDFEAKLIQASTRLLLPPGSN